MAELKKVTLPDGRSAEGIEVFVAQSNERWSEFTFDDGTVVRAKMTMSSAVRVPGEYDPQGNPLYIVNLAPIMMIASVPEEYRRKPS